MWERQKQVIKGICSDCGDPTMMASASYVDTARFFGKEKFYVDFLEEKAFAYGIVNKRHFRLIAIAVREQHQGTGLAQVLLAQIAALCFERGLSKITLRTHKGGRALHFWLRQGARVVGENGEDYEMEIVL